MSRPRPTSCVRRLRAPFIICAALLLPEGTGPWTGTPLLCQDHSSFNITLSTDYSAAEEMILLLQDEYVDTRKLAGMRGNRIAASTTGLIAGRENVPGLLRSYLDSLRDHLILEEDIYGLEEARRNAEAIADIVAELKKRNFDRRIIATVEQIFPRDINVTAAIPVYVVALGHGNADAYVRRIVWEGDTPRFSGADRGEVTIIINVAAAATYRGETADRIRSILMTVAHEVFHAAFAVYKDSSRFWKRYREQHGGALDDLVDLVQNEGIAYYLSLEQRIGHALPVDWHDKMNESFRVFNANAERLMSGTLTQRETASIIYSANLSGYWDSYGSMVGMSMAREVDLSLGREALIETISNGPVDMLRKYRDLTENDSSLPRLSPRLLRNFGIE